MKDPYIYPGTDILKNKFNITNEKIINEMEAEYTSFRLKQCIELPLPGEYDFAHLCKLHKFLFQDIYDWAGEPRIIDIEKPEIALGGISIEYSNFKDITKDAEKSLNKMKRTKWNNINLDEVAERFSLSMSELWKIHCFREGNTRTIVTFCCQYIENQGIKINRKLFEENSAYVRTSLVAASSNFKDLGDKSDSTYLIKIVKASIEKNV